jgi:cytochrome oxidase Cu insertion factor (SCO1/SenC/PrrC family)
LSGFLLACLALGLVVVTGIIWFRSAYAVTLPTNRIAYVIAMGTGAVLAVFALADNPGLVGGTFAVLAALLGCFFLFTVAISEQKGGAGNLVIGSPMPAFSARDHLGNPFDSSTLDGRPVLLKFFRGHW